MRTWQKMKKFFDKGSKALPELAVGDKVCIQNHTTVRTMMWDKSGVITQVKRDIQYKVQVDGSRRLTVRNRRQLRMIPDQVDINKPMKEAEKAEVEEVE